MLLTLRYTIVRQICNNYTSPKGYCYFIFTLNRCNKILKKIVHTFTHMLLILFCEVLVIFQVFSKWKALRCMAAAINFISKAYQYFTIFSSKLSRFKSDNSRNATTSITEICSTLLFLNRNSKNILVLLFIPHILNIHHF